MDMSCPPTTSSMSTSKLSTSSATTASSFERSSPSQWETTTRPTCIRSRTYSSVSSSPPSSLSSPSPSAKLVNVAAPTNGGRPAFPVTVPPEGIHYGQAIRVPLMQNEIKLQEDDHHHRHHDNGQSHYTTPTKKQSETPTACRRFKSIQSNICADDESECEKNHKRRKGQWKDGICSCFRFGVCHPAVCNAWICPQILLAQILTRMGMSWMLTEESSPSSPKSNKNSTSSSSSLLKKLMMVLLIFTLYDFFFSPPLFEFDVNEQGDIILIMDSPAGNAPSQFSSTINNQNETQITNNILWHQLIYLLLTLPTSLYGLALVVKLRKAIRSKYDIPAGRMGALEDFCCVCLCNCCALAQMARQTANYDSDEPASWCSPSGVVRDNALSCIARTPGRDVSSSGNTCRNDQGKEESLSSPATTNDTDCPLISPQSPCMAVRKLSMSSDCSNQEANSILSVGSTATTCSTSDSLCSVSSNAV